MNDFLVEDPEVKEGVGCDCIDIASLSAELLSKSAGADGIYQRGVSKINECRSRVAVTSP